MGGGVGADCGGIVFWGGGDLVKGSDNQATHFGWGIPFVEPLGHLMLRQLAVPLQSCISTSQNTAKRERISMCLLLGLLLVLTTNVEETL
jgi:hypothetical protein